jgi:EVE domain
MPTALTPDPHPVWPKCWVAVAAAEHVRIGRAEGFMQVCHGKGAPLRRISPGDWVVYYSPTETFRGKDRLQAFTAIGVIGPGEPYQAEMCDGFHPFRRNVRWIKSAETPIRLLLEALTFSAGNKNWSYKLRFGLFEIDRQDMRKIARAMGASVIPVGVLSPPAPVNQVNQRSQEPDPPLSRAAG